MALTSLIIIEQLAPEFKRDSGHLVKKIAWYTCPYIRSDCVFNHQLSVVKWQANVVQHSDIKVSTYTLAQSGNWPECSKVSLAILVLNDYPVTPNTKSDLRVSMKNITVTKSGHIVIEKFRHHAYTIRHDNSSGNKHSTQCTL